MTSAQGSYERLRAAHGAVQGALQDHIGRIEWSREQIEVHQTIGCGRCWPTPASGRRFMPGDWRTSIRPSVTAADLAGCR